jgi:hypothetical protein
MALGSTAIKLSRKSAFTKIDFAVKGLIEASVAAASTLTLRILGIYSAATLVGST